jgi:hypothetical protein
MAIKIERSGGVTATTRMEVGTGGATIALFWGAAE